MTLVVIALAVVWFGPIIFLEWLDFMGWRY